MATKKTSDDAKMERFLAKAQAQQDREYDRDIRRIKQAIAGAKFLGWELEEIKRLVFGAYGRTKLGG